MDDANEVEVNLMASKKGKHRFDNKKVKEESQPSTSQSSSDAKFDSMLSANRYYDLLMTLYL